MAFTPFDFNEAIAQRRDHALEGLRHGSPVVGLSLDAGLVLLTVRRTQRKIYEIYDRLIYSAIGNQSDIEAVRLGAVDLAAREGFERSPDDVTAQRLVGFSLSPALKEVFRDQWRAPSVIRAIFGELGPKPEDDVFFVLNYDGEFSQHAGAAAIAGTHEAEERMLNHLRKCMDRLGATPPGVDSDALLTSALAEALRAWAVGLIALREQPDREEDEAAEDPALVVAALKEELATGRVEAGILDRATKREAKFAMVAPDVLARATDLAMHAEGA